MMSNLPQNKHKSGRDKYNSSSLDTAQKKLLLVFAYYCLMGIFIVLLSLLIASVVNADSIADGSLYFVCESFGEIPGRECKQLDLTSLHAIASVFNLMMGLYPLVCMLYAIDFGELKKKYVSQQQNIDICQRGRAISL